MAKILIHLLDEEEPSWFHGFESADVRPAAQAQAQRKAHTEFTQRPAVTVRRVVINTAQRKCGREMQYAE
jgi:hypothetical protein